MCFRLYTDAHFFGAYWEKGGILNTLVIFMDYYSEGFHESLKKLDDSSH